MLSQVAEMQGGGPRPPALPARQSQPGWERLTKNQTKCGEKCEAEGARLPWEQRGACSGKNERSSLHLCIAFSFFKEMGVKREGGGTEN